MQTTERVLEMSAAYHFSFLYWHAHHVARAAREEKAARASPSPPLFFYLLVSGVWKRVSQPLAESEFCANYYTHASSNGTVGGKPKKKKYSPQAGKYGLVGIDGILSARGRGGG